MLYFILKGGALLNKKVKKLYDKLLQGVQEVFSSEKYAKFLEFSKNFRSYSFENTILIFAQKPDATYVAGYKLFLRLCCRMEWRPEKTYKVGQRNYENC